MVTIALGQDRAEKQLRALPRLRRAAMEETPMRYEKGHKDATRQRIIDVASRQFRENGVAAAGVAGIMTDAGLTNGAFYSHFESKEDLVQAVVFNALDRREETLRTAAKADAGLETTIRDYLSSRHRIENNNCTCWSRYECHMRQVSPLMDEMDRITVRRYNFCIFVLKQSKRLASMNKQAPV